MLFPSLFPKYYVVVKYVVLMHLLSSFDVCRCVCIFVVVLVALVHVVGILVLLSVVVFSDVSAC